MILRRGDGGREAPADPSTGIPVLGDEPFCFLHLLATGIGCGSPRVEGIRVHRGSHTENRWVRFQLHEKDHAFGTIRPFSLACRFRYPSLMSLVIGDRVRNLLVLLPFRNGSQSGDEGPFLKLFDVPIGALPNNRHLRVRCCTKRQGIWQEFR